MRKLFIFFILILSSLQADATQCTNYLKSTYSSEGVKKIVSKSEHIQKYEQKFGNYYVSNIAYGRGYVKYGFCKKKNIVYICLLDENCVPYWGCISDLDK